MSISATDNTDLLLVFRGLTAPESRALLAQTHNGPLYRDDIDALAARLEEEAAAGLPLAAELRDEDALHDALGLYLWHQLSAYRAVAALPDFADAAALAADLQARYIDSRARLTAGYGEQAAHAGRARRRLDDDRAALARFGAFDGARLDAMAERFIQSGERIGELMTRRADQLAQRAHAKDEAGRNLRGQAIALLGELRAQLRNEAKRRPELPTDLDKRLFALLDERVARRVDRARSGRPAGGEGAGEGVGEGAAVEGEGGAQG